MYEDYFSNRLMQLQEQKKISAREMSLALGQNESYINRIENKKTFPSIQSFFYICEYLNIFPSDFFNEDILNPNISNEILDNLKDLTETQINIILDIIKELKNK